jgi:hypothetical protein
MGRRVGCGTPASSRMGRPGPRPIPVPRPPAWSARRARSGQGQGVAGYQCGDRGGGVEPVPGVGDVVQPHLLGPGEVIALRRFRHAPAIPAGRVPVLGRVGDSGHRHTGLSVAPVEELGELGRQRHLYTDQHQQFRHEPAGGFLGNELHLVRRSGGGSCDRRLAGLRHRHCHQVARPFARGGSPFWPARTVVPPPRAHQQRSRPAHPPDPRPGHHPGQPAQESTPDHPLEHPSPTRPVDRRLRLHPVSLAETSEGQLKEVAR